MTWEMASAEESDLRTSIREKGQRRAREEEKIEDKKNTLLLSYIIHLILLTIFELLQCLLLLSRQVLLVHFEQCIWSTSNSNRAKQRTAVGG